MKLTMTALCVAAAATLAMGSGVQAQSGMGQSGQSGSMHSQSSKASKVKLTGCLQADPSGNGYILTNVTEGESSASSSYGSSSTGSTTSGSSGTSGSSSSGTSGSTSGSGTTGSGSTSGTVSEQSGAAAPSANSVELVGKSSELKTLVGQRVEVTGTPAGKSNKLDKSSSSSGTSGSSSSTSGSTSSGTTGSEQTGSMTGSSTMGEGHWQGQKIRVDSVRQVASSCSGQ